MAEKPKILTRAWWAETLSSAFRQGIQAALPYAGAVAAGGVVGGWGGAAFTVVVAVAVTFVTALAKLTVTAADPLWVQVLVRAIKAAAGVFLGLTFASLADVISTDWKSVGLQMLGAAFISVSNFYFDPPKPAIVAAGDSGEAETSTLDESRKWLD